jgi:hypothetical protein
MTTFIYEIDDAKTPKEGNANPTIEMHLPTFVRIKATPITIEDPAAQSPRGSGRP